jgi:hypothetical protein
LKKQLKGLNFLTASIMGKTDTFFFVKDKDELADSLYEFYSKKEFWRPALSSSPRYFIHSNHKGRHYFGLSKFCVFRDITVEQYIMTFRYLTDGGKTQQYLSKCCKQQWIPFDSAATDVQNAFEQWIVEFFRTYKLSNANFITIDISTNVASRKKYISPEKLLGTLELQRRIGAAGEEIALRFEIKRLQAQGIKNPQSKVHHESKRNAAAGYDIFSETRNETRYIEVKTSLTDTRDFFITENEYATLDTLADCAYIYFVKLDGITSLKGYVYKVLNNPIQALLQRGEISPIAYRVRLE